MFVALVITFAALATLAAPGAPASPSAATPAAAEPHQVLWRDGVKNAYPRWSKDGSRILFQSNRGGNWQIFVMDRDGSRQTQLTQGDANNNFPDWSPDNRSIAFVSDRDGNEEIYVMAADGGGARNLSRDPAQDIHPYWSPDGTIILFNSTRAGGALQIYQMNRDGTEERRLVTSGDDDTCARLSPDGRRILYLANLAAGRDDVMMRRRDGSDPVNVTDDAPPDGAHIVYASRRGAAFALYTLRSDGLDARRLTGPPEGYADVRPSVSTDGRRIVFNRERGDTIGIYVVDVPSDWWRTPAPKEGP